MYTTALGDTLDIEVDVQTKAVTYTLLTKDGAKFVRMQHFESLAKMLGDELAQG